VGSLTSHNPIGLHGLLRGVAILFPILYSFSYRIANGSRAQDNGNVTRLLSHDADAAGYTLQYWIKYRRDFKIEQGKKKVKIIPVLN
jgi:hypothetical protein